MKTWRILYETGDEAYVVKETLEEAIVYAREQGAFPFFLVMEISEVKEQAGEVERFSPDKLPPPPWNLSVGEFHVSEVWR